ncbi:unnamed protein product [Leptosia nina]|uniref:Uncharacterized protein n=1 Tax=Leptosia nina TaxID=320188 RepID=A0AAV1J534_9NEOP
MQFDQLKSPDSDDNRIFRRIIAPAIQKFREHNGVAVTPKEHIGDEKKVLNVSQLKANLLQILNKFSMSMTKETENNSFDFIQPSLKIYFFGPHTSLVVSNGEQHFHYFVNPPSSLPRWFYEEHKNELQIDETLSVEIPEEVKQELYIRLYNLLHVFFSFPI